MKIITFEDIRELEISPRTCFEWVRACMEKKKDAVLPAKISMRPEEGVFYNVMPCIPDGAWGGVKVITRYPERKPCMDSRLLLTDIKTGRFLALMDGNWITAMRTGAVAAHSVLLFSRKGFSNIGIIGTGIRRERRFWYLRKWKQTASFMSGCCATGGRKRCLRVALRNIKTCHLHMWNMWNSSYSSQRLLFRPLPS